MHYILSILIFIFLTSSCAVRKSLKVQETVTIRQSDLVLLGAVDDTVAIIGHGIATETPEKKVIVRQVTDQKNKAKTAKVKEYFTIRNSGQGVSVTLDCTTVEIAQTDTMRQRSEVTEIYKATPEQKNNYRWQGAAIIVLLMSAIWFLVRNSKK
jgi:hypothetical protein